MLLESYEIIYIIFGVTTFAIDVFVLQN